jgi:GNAT superfamily N-acetyltransferase
MIKSGKMKGYLAFENSSPVGWCNVNDFSTFYRVYSTHEVASLNREGKTAAIICFIIDSNHRGKGIARMLLKQAISDCRQQGFSSLEAYPRLGNELSQADQFHGPLPLYLSEGFEIKKSYGRYAVVCHNLQPG